MNNIRKAFAVVIALVLLAGLAMTVAAATGNKTVYAGESVTVTFTYKDSYSLDGQFTVNDPNGIIEGTPDYRIQDRDGMQGGQISGNKVFLYDTSNPATAHDVVVSAVVNIKSTAKVGDTCKITFSYNRGTEGTGMEVQSGSDTATIEVVKKDEEKPTNPTKPTTKPTTKIDRTELERQISIAESLNEKDYTSETWGPLKDALKNAKSRMTTGTQDDVDAAAKQLESAIAALKRVDRTGLTAAIDSVKGLSDNAQLGDLLKQLMEAMFEGEKLMNSNDQAAIDAATAKINELVEKVRDLLGEMSNGETVVEKVPVEVEPTGPYCNVKMHPIWIIIAIVSLIANVAFIVVIVVFVGKKKNNRKDNTPLVDYDISDDA